MQPAKIFALLVGINEYQPPVPALRGCVNDLEKVDQYLRAQSNHFDLHIKHLIDSAATKFAIIDQIQDHLGLANNDDVVFFYFSGHGTQEDADPLFWQEEPDRKLEALVCYDSYSRKEGRVRINLLADKELRYLFYQVAKNAPHIVSIFDCCHSGGNTRNGYISENQSVLERRFVNRKRRSQAFPVRNWEDFLFAENVPIDQAQNNPLSTWLPEGNHIQMAACQDDQSAFEVNGEGVFTKNLIDLLTRCQGGVTYFDLQSRIQNYIKNQFDQQPKIYVAGPNENILFHGFLNRSVAAKPIYGNINFNVSQGWFMDLGAMHGIQAQSTVKVVSSDHQKVFQARVKQIFPGHCCLSFEPNEEHQLDKAIDYQGYQEDYLSAPLGIFLDPLVETQKLVFDGMKDQRYLNLLPERHQADFCMEIKDRNIIISRPQFPGVPVVPPQPFSSESKPKVVFNFLHHISQYEFVKNLHNPNSFLFPSDPLEITVYKSGLDGRQEKLAIRNGTLTFDFFSAKDPHTSDKIQIKLRNRFDRKLYLALLYLTFNFGVKTKLLSEVVQGLDPGRETWAFNGEAIGLTLEPEVIKYNYPQSTSYLKLLACTEDFKNQITRFELPDLPSPLTDYRGAKGLEVESYNPGVIQDWTTRLITLRIPNPSYSE